VYDAYKAVKANAGAAGVDGQSLEMFDKDASFEIRVGEVH
jgi:RNA-directed DNA polymerase